jgi:hypothetical protein
MGRTSAPITRQTPWRRPFLMSCPTAASPYRHYTLKTLFPCPSEQAPRAACSDERAVIRLSQGGDPVHRRRVRVPPVSRSPRGLDGFVRVSAAGMTNRSPLQQFPIRDIPFDNTHVARIGQRLGAELRATDFCPPVADRCLLTHNHRITTDWSYLIHFWSIIGCSSATTRQQGCR